MISFSALDQFDSICFIVFILLTIVVLFIVCCLVWCVLLFPFWDGLNAFRLFLRHKFILTLYMNIYSLYICVCAIVCIGNWLRRMPHRLCTNSPNVEMCLCAQMHIPPYTSNCIYICSYIHCVVCVLYRSHANDVNCDIVSPGLLPLKRSNLFLFQLGIQQ